MPLRQAERMKDRLHRHLELKHHNVRGPDGAFGRIDIGRREPRIRARCHGNRVFPAGIHQNQGYT